jgi:Region found in RelA / SpoT proteins
MEWVSPQYSRSQVDKAGEVLIRPHPAADELNDALTIISNWRSSHSRPLYTFRIGLRRHAERVDETALVAQRIKRLSSISLKLNLIPGMKLSRMQDIGGCRAVVGTAKQVRTLVERYKKSDIKHKLLSEDDYISKPKISGYRSYHLIYRYFSDKKASHNGLRIELQVRSQVQHAWATAVEIVGTFTQQALKSSQGQEEWLRFFALMGSALALSEGSPLVPRTPTDPDELKRELRESSIRLDVAGRLQAYGAAVQVVDAPHVENADYYLLELDPGAMRVNVNGYRRNQLSIASGDYLEAEKRISGTGSDAVLVSADSMLSLRRAYPNYFLDTTRFLEAVTKAIE